MSSTRLRRTSRAASCPGRDMGAAAVEFALIVPILLALVFGVMEFGTLMAQKSTVASSVRAGARYGSVNVYGGAAGVPHTCARVVERTRDEAVTLALSGDDLAITVTLVSPDGTPSVVCASAAGSTTVTPSSAATALPCTLPASAVRPGVLKVKAQFRGELGIPLVGPLPDPDLTSTGSYSCEYK